MELKIPTPKKLSAKINSNSINGPFLAKLNLNSLYLSGRILNKTCEPSSGGMGIRLKIAKTRLIIMSINKKFSNKLSGPKLPKLMNNFNTRPKITTLTRLVAMPARETRLSLVFPFF